MRELTIDELDFISGSGYYDNEDVVVTGTRYPPPYSFPPSYPPGVGGGPPSYPSGGGPTTPPSFTPCQEKAVDNEAWEAAEAIKEMPTGNPMTGPEYEYGAVIYRDASGNFQTAPLQTNYSDSNVTFSAPGVNARDFVGIIHNHPVAMDGADVANRQPSPTDWSQFDQLRTQIAAAGGNADNFRTYVVGPDTTVRQYDKNSVRGQESTDVVSGTQYC